MLFQVIRFVLICYNSHEKLIYLLSSEMVTSSKKPLLTTLAPVVAPRPTSAKKAVSPPHPGRCLAKVERAWTWGQKGLHLTLDLDMRTKRPGFDLGSLSQPL